MKLKVFHAIVQIDEIFRYNSVVRPYAPWDNDWTRVTVHGISFQYKKYKRIPENIKWNPEWKEVTALEGKFGSKQDCLAALHKFAIQHFKKLFDRGYKIVGIPT